MYIHGFNRSLRAFKGQVIQRWMQHQPCHVYMPEVACSPAEAMAK